MIRLTKQLPQLESWKLRSLICFCSFSFVAMKILCIITVSNARTNGVLVYYCTFKFTRNYSDDVHTKSSVELYNRLLQ
jgi:hypothetical protein